MPDQVTVDKRQGDRRCGDDRRTGVDRRNPNAMIASLDDDTLRRVTGDRRNADRRTGERRAD